MASESVEDCDDFDLYHVDFTTASEWEVFIARIEEILQQWKLNNKKHHLNKENLSCATWVSQTENVTFADFEFNITRHYTKGAETDSIEEKKSPMPDALDEMMCADQDFLVAPAQLGEEDVLVTWYGLSDFVTLTPAKGTLSSESKLKVLLSSLCMAVNNVGCEVPTFVKFWEPWQKFYMGICEGQGFRTEFEMIHLKKIPSQCRHLTGLLNLFKSKIETEMREPVSVSAKFGYTLQDWTNFTWSQEPPDIELFAADIGWSELSCLPFGAVCEPISTLTLHTCWPEVVETAMVDSETFSDFDPLTAPRWSLSVSRADNPVCLLTDYLAEFLLFCTSKKTAEDLMGDFASRDTGGGEMLQPFSLLTESRIPTLSNLLNQYASRKKSVEGPICQKLLMPILYYLFPDVEDSSKYPYSSDCETEKVSGQRMKTCGVDSLVWRLALVMAHGLHMFGGAKAAAHIWHEFSQEVRFRWNSGNIIPGVAPGFPDPKTCLLHQKLQMVNCCIERKQKREEAALTQKDSEESEDEFFDCDEAVEEVRHAPWNTPVGRLRPHGSLKLINSGHPLYVPVTQGATPKTEDQLEEDAQVLIQLGADAEGSQMRAKIMSASLLSDMESFKAANPGAVIEDFIRWYSPRDWVEEDDFDEYGQRKGKLSARMTLPGNTWLEVWEAAKPVPAARQKRLFDETREAEKALHFLESQPPGSCATLVLPVLAHAAVNRLSDATKDIILPSLESTVHQAVKRTEALTRHTPVDIRRYHDLCQEIGQAETVASQISSLEVKLGGDEAARVLAARLVSMPETELPDGPSGSVAARLKAMFTEAYKASLLTNDVELTSGAGGDRACVLPPANEKEFILRGWAPRPSRGARPSPHRLHARVTRHHLSMATAFSLDNTFF